MSKLNPNGRRARTSLAAMAMFGSLAGILLYSKLKLTTAMPRSAYAVPEESNDGAETPAVDESVTSEKLDDGTVESSNESDAASGG